MAELDWEQLARTLLPAGQVAILERAAETPDEAFSADEMAATLGTAAASIAYDLKALHEARLIRRAGDAPGERRYALTAKALRLR